MELTLRHSLNAFQCSRTTYPRHHHWPQCPYWIFFRWYSPLLMKRIMSMDTIPSKVEEWYSKAIHFQMQWERAEEIAQRNRQPTKGTYHSFSHPTLSKTCDPDEWKCCIKKGLCFHCWKAGHLSTTCPTFSTLMKKVWWVKQDKEVDEHIHSLKEIDDDDEDVVRQVSFLMDF